MLRLIRIVSILRSLDRISCDMEIRFDEDCVFVLAKYSFEMYFD